MSVRRLDPETTPPDFLAEIHRMLADAHAEANAEEPYRSSADTEAFLRHPPASEDRSYWIADGDAGCTGFAQVSAVIGSKMAQADVVVRRDARRRGHGTALLEAVRAHAQTLGCRTMMGQHATAPGSAFAASTGARDTRRNVRSLLSLPSAPLASRDVAGYSLRTWIGPAPDGIVASFAAAREAVNDAPRADDDEWEPWDVVRVRDLEATLERRSRDVRVTAAIDAAGKVAGFTELRVARSAGALATTEDTAVLREHRRRGLARWIKTESLRRLRSDRPEVRLVTTTNAESNAAILRLNRSLGFRPVAVYTTCVLDL